MKNKLIYQKAAKIALASIAAAVGILLLVRLFAWADKHDVEAAQRQKECWREIYLIIEESPGKKADWVKQTVSNQSSALGGVDYCKTVKLIKNGPDP